MPWIQFLAGPVLWSIHFVLNYLLVEAFCQAGWNFSLLGINGLSMILISFTVLAAISIGLFGVKSYRGWRNMNKDRSLKDELQKISQRFEGPFEFMYLSGFLLSVLFTVAILMVGVPAFFLQPCA